MKLDYSDNIKKDQFPEVIYETYTTWTGDGIPLPDNLEPGDYEIHVKYFWNGARKPQIMKSIKFKINGTR